MAGRVHGGDRAAVEREIDRLFELPPEEFVKERDAAAKRRRAAGDTDGANALSRLRRPTVAAWAIDQLARRNPDAVGELIALGESLQRAQRRALSGVGAHELRELGAQRRRVVERLAQEADAALLEAGRSVSPAVHQAITSTLEAAAVSPQDASALQQGRLERDLAPQSGFDAVDGFTVVEPPKRAARGRTKTPRDASAPDRRRRDVARVRVREMSEQADRRRREESDAGEAFRSAERDADAAASRVEELEHTLRDARNELDDARQRSRAARRGLDDARRAGVRAEQALDAARAALERLDAD